MVDISACRAAVVEHAPLIQCITNTVVQQFSANVLLAIGAAPAMFDHEADAAQFARVADGLLVNFGTATSQQFLGAEAAVDGVQASGTPWVLDPVSLGVGDYRTSRILAAARRRPTVLRGNASEIVGLAGLGGGARGTDAVDSVESALPAAAVLSRDLGSVVAISGPKDAIVQAQVPDGGPARVRIIRIRGGHPLMPTVIGTGCALGAAAAAYVAAAGRAGGDAMTGVAAAHAHFAVAGAAAGNAAKGPGTFAVEFIDSLYATGPQDLAEADTSEEVVGLADLIGPAAAGRTGPARHGTSRESTQDTTQEDARG